MENNNSNRDAQDSSPQQNLSIYSNQPTTVSRAVSSIRPSKRVKLENQSVGVLACSITADLYCDVCDLSFPDSSGLLLHIKNSSSHKDLAHDFEKRKIDEQVEHKTEHHSWSTIPADEYPLALEALQAHCHSSHDLQRRSYVIRPYTDEDCAGLTKCTNCRRLQCDLDRRDNSKCNFHPGKRPFKKPGGEERLYSCCRKSGEGCESQPMHSYGLPDPKYQQIAVTPTGPHKEPRRRAVALDCEMALVQTTTVPYKASELILLCAVDYLTGETLINTHVSPESHVIDWCTKYSGVTAHTMAEAEAQGKALKGWQEARFELWKYIDADTILVGQSLQNDLHVLRMIHTMVVDSAILTNLAVGFECTREWSLKVLCDELLGMKIQTQGKKGHVCVEDAFATREVVLLCCQYPERLETWATVKRKEQLVQQGVRKDALENAKREKAKLKGEQQQAREEALEKAMIERARVKEQQQKVREEGLEIVDGSASKVNEKGGLETEQVQDMEAEKRQEIRREKQRRKRRKQQEKRQNNLQLELEHSRSSVPPSSSRALIGDSAHNDGEALQQSQSSVGSIIREKLLDEHPADKGKALRQSDIAEEVAAAFQPTLNKILGLIKAPSSRAV